MLYPEHSRRVNRGILSVVRLRRINAVFCNPEIASGGNNKDEALVRLRAGKMERIKNITAVNGALYSQQHFRYQKYFG